jgi:hypothetical protein
MPYRYVDPNGVLRSDGESLLGRMRTAAIKAGRFQAFGVYEPDELSRP